MPMKVFFFALLLIFVGTSYAEKAPLVVGVIAPLSGDLAEYGTAVVNGMRLANEAIPGEPLKLEIEDNAKCDAPSAISSFQKIAATNQLSVVVTVCTAAAQGILPIVQSRRLPLIQLTESGVDPNNWMLKLMPDSVRMASLNSELYAEKYKSLAIIATDMTVNVGERGNVQVVTKAFEARGGSVVFSDLVPPGANDFRPIIEKVRRSNAQAVAPFIGSANSMALFLKQADELQLWSRKRLVGNFFFEFMHTELSKLYPRLLRLDGLQSVNIAQTTDSTFRQLYKNRYGTEPLQFADYGYDTITILKICGTDTECYRVSRPGVSGRLVFDEQNRRSGSFEVKEMRGGKFVSIRTMMSGEQIIGADR
jgi:branched-chain amino acid transport system substrate-binding protein